MSIDNSETTTKFNSKAFELRKNEVINEVLKYSDQKKIEKSDLKILDFGCGNGFLIYELEKYGFTVLGVDVDIGQVERAREITDKSEIIQCSIYDYEDSENKYDVILSLEVLEHLYDPEKYLKLCYQYLKPGGLFCLSTPYYGYFKNLLISITNKWDRHHMPLTLHGHIKLFSHKALNTILRKTGFKQNGYSKLGRVSLLAMMMFVTATKLE